MPMQSRIAEAGGRAAQAAEGLPAEITRIKAGRTVGCCSLISD